MTNDASEWVAITPLKPKLKILIFALSIHSQNEISYYLTQFSLLRCKWIPNCFSSQKDILKVESLIIYVHHHCWRLSQLMGNTAIINYPSGKITSHSRSFKEFITKITFIWTKTLWEHAVSIELLLEMFPKPRSRDRRRDRAKETKWELRRLTHLSPANTNNWPLTTPQWLLLSYYKYFSNPSFIHS